METSFCSSSSPFIITIVYKHIEQCSTKNEFAPNRCIICSIWGKLMSVLPKSTYFSFDLGQTRISFTQIDIFFARFGANWEVYPTI